MCVCVCVFYLFIYIYTPEMLYYVFMSFYVNAHINFEFRQELRKK